MAQQSTAQTDRAHDAETVVITFDSPLTASQRARIRRAVDRRAERLADDSVFVSRERGRILVTVTPDAVDAADEFGGPAFPSVADVRAAAVRAAHREADAIAIAAGVTVRYSVEPYRPAAEPTTDYVVYRHGSNAANQSMIEQMPLGIYEGVGKTALDRHRDACRQAEAEHTVYANQHLTARPVAHAPEDDVIAAREQQIAEYELRASF